MAYTTSVEHWQIILGAMGFWVWCSKAVCTPAVGDAIVVKRVTALLHFKRAGVAQHFACTMEAIAVR